MNSWPETLPQSVHTDYELQPRSGLLSETEDRNPTRNRTYPEWAGTLSMAVSTAQLAVFRAFYDTTINQSGEFECPWLEDLGFNFHFVRFLSSPSWRISQAPGMWILTLPLEIIAGVEMDGSDISIFPPEES
jgi:hypothetical protein